MDRQHDQGQERSSGFLMTNVFGAQGVTGFNITSLIVAVIGAAVLLFLVRRT